MFVTEVVLVIMASQVTRLKNPYGTELTNTSGLDNKKWLYHVHCIYLGICLLFGFNVSDFFLIIHDAVLHM